VNRDFVTYVSLEAAGAGGTISLRGEPEIREAFGDVLRQLDEIITGFERLLANAPDGVEEVFHEYLARYPIILDLYASEAVSKPRLEYPGQRQEGEKAYVEPDFVLRLPELRYRLIELERPRTPILKKSGEGRAETSHAAFQVAEWRSFIESHADTLQERFPHMVASSVETLLVLGRDHETAGSADSFATTMSTVRAQYGADEILTYDGLIRRARQALISLQALR
jgi:hypothetical protein